MDATIRVDPRVEDGGRLLVELVRSGLDVTIAFWGKSAEDERWRLFIASDAFRGGGIGDQFLRVYSCLARIPKVRIDISEIILIDSNAELAQRLKQFQEDGPSLVGPPLLRRGWGESQIDEALVYGGALKAATETQLLERLAGSMARRRVGMPPVTVQLHSGKVVQGYPVNIEMKGTSFQTTLRDEYTGIEETVAIGDIQTFL